MNVGEGFERFYADWLDQAKHQLAALRKALDQHHSDQEIILLVESCCKLYHDCARVKTQVAEEDLSYVAGGRWQTSYISGLLWLGGYRPITATVLLFSLMGAQVKESFPKLTAGHEFQADLLSLLEGCDVPALASLSSTQIHKVDSLQRHLRDEEDSIDKNFALQQMNVADQPLASATLAEPPPSESFDLSRIRDAIAPKLAALRQLVVEAEMLRCRALREIIDILNPVQAGQYTIATFEFAIALRKLGQPPQAADAQAVSSAATSGSTQDVWTFAEKGDVASLRQALRAGSAPSSDFLGRTALHVAAMNGHLDCVELLIGIGEDVNAKDVWGRTALVSTLKAGHDKVAELLCQHGAALLLEDPGLELCQAAACGDMEYVKRLVLHGLDINSEDYGKQTALHIAVAYGTVEAVKLLLELGADVSVRSRNGNTPADEAKLRKHEDIQEALKGHM